MRVAWKALPLLLCALAFGATFSVYDNLGAPVFDFFIVAPVKAEGDGPLFASFSTGGSAVSLAEVQLQLANFNDLADATPAARRAGKPARGLAKRSARVGSRAKSGIHPDPAIGGGSITVGLYSDSATSPGSLLTTIGSLPDTSLPTGGTGAVVTFPLTTVYPLAANTRYWIGLSTANDSVAVWIATDVNTGTGVANEFNYGDGEVFANTPADIGEPFIMNVTVTGNAAPPPVTPVPPSVTLGLIGLAFTGLYFTGRRFAFRRTA